MLFRNLLNRISAYFKTHRGKNILKWTQRIINAGVFVWLIYQLSVIGWQKVWFNLPTQPLFYLFFLFIFFQLPLFEIFIYRMIWDFNTLKSIPVFVLKRVYNKDVMGYSGEFYFYAWAKKTLKKTGKEIFKIIKDNNIISSVASTFISIALISVFLFTGQIKIIESIANQNELYFVVGLLLVIIVVFLFIKFRHQVISMPIKSAYKIFGLQTLRLLLGQFFNLLMFYIILPDVPFYIWFTFIALDIILSRIPFLPNRDLIFAGMSIALAGRMAVPRDAIAGITLTKGVLNKVGGFISFGVVNLFKQGDIVPVQEERVEEFETIKE